jgi:general stress protein YciG
MAETNNRKDPSGKKSIRGFAAMDQEKQREIARKGGRAAHEQGVAHEWSSQEAREAGKKGGQARGRQPQSGREEASPM